MRLHLTCVVMLFLFSPSQVFSRQSGVDIEMSLKEQYARQHHLEYLTDKAKRKEIVDVTDRWDRGFLDWAGLNGKPIKKIVLVSATPFLGDDLLATGILIHPLHLRFPEAEITVFSPWAGILKPQPWLTPIPLKVSGRIEKGLQDQPNPVIKETGSYFEFYKKLSKSPPTQYEQEYIDYIVHTVSPYLGQDTIVYVDEKALGSPVIQSMIGVKSEVSQIVRDLHSMIVDKITKALKEQSRQKRGLLWLHDARGLPSEFIVPEDISSPFINGLQSSRYPPYELNSYFPGMDNIYKDALVQNQVLFGTDSEVNFPRDIFVDMASNEALDGFLISKGLDPKKQLIVLHLNTTTGFKAKLALPHLESIYSLLLEHLNEKYPDFNVLITPIEKVGIPRADQAYRRIESMVSAHRSQAIFLPPDFKLIDRAIDRSAKVITFDSGLNHLAAAIIKEPKDVLVIGLEGKDKLKKWIVPGQPLSLVEDFVISRGKKGLKAIDRLLTTPSIDCRSLSPRVLKQFQK